MKFKKSIILLAFAIFIFTMAGVCASDMNDTIVASEDTGQMILSADNGLAAENGVEILAADGVNNYSELRKDIEDGGNLTKSYYRYEDGDGDTIKITSPCVIEGNGAIIDMAGSPVMRAFYVTSSGVTIKNLTIKNANFNNVGGAIYFGASGTVEDCTFINNNASVFYGLGGAVYFDYNTTANVTNCNFINNTAGHQGGALYLSNYGNVTNCSFINNTAVNDGGALAMKSGCVENSNFTGNKGEISGFGGAIYVTTESAVKIINCNFINNTATDGGAVYFDEDATGEFIGCNFTNNRASGKDSLGGALFLFESAALSDCNFVNNSAYCGGAINIDSGSVVNCNFTDNTAYDRGGALYVYVNANVTNCNFINNSANNSGGAVYVYRAFSDSKIDSIFINNTAKNGGAIYFNGDISNTTINSTFTANNAERAGGAIYVRGQSMNNSFASEFYGNRANQASGGAIFFSSLAEGNSFEGIFADNYALYGGAAFFYKPANDNEFDADFISNVAKSCGGAMFFYNTTDGNSFAGSFVNNSALGQVDASVGNGGAITFKNTSTNSVFTCDFINNTAALNGGGVNYRQTPYNITFNSNFINNTAPRGGGVNFFDSFENVIFNGEFIANSANIGGAIAAREGIIENVSFKNNYAEKGGAVFFGVNGTVSNCNFTDNKALGSGGAILAVNAINILNSLFVNNSAANLGGAVYINNTYSNSKIDSTFINNTAKNGGAIYFNGNVSNVSVNSTFTANNAERAGGAIYVRGQSRNNSFTSEFYDNRAKQASGGAIFFSGLAEGNSFEGIFADNYALYGGAVFFYKPANDNEFDADFISNVAESCGGAMFFYSTTDSNSFAGSFVNNSALGQVDASVGNGGAITFKNTSTNSVFTCDFINNTAALNGGGVNYRQTPYNITFNSNFINNTAPRGGGVNFFDSFENVIFNGEFIANSAIIGGAIAAREGIIENVSFNDNRAEKGGAVFFGVNGTVSNCNFTDNNASGSGGAILAVNAINILNSLFVNNSAANLGGAVYINNTYSNSIIDSAFINNSAKNGGAISFYGGISNATVNSTFTGNSAERAGGAIYVLGQSMNNNFTSEFYGNRANQASGGAIFFSSLAEGNSFEGIFADNYALYGGGIFFYKPANDNEFDADFTFNVAESCGGAMFFYSTTDSNSFAGSFINNSALGQVDASVGNGGAITFKNTSTNSVFTCDFINNTAALNGGGVNYRQTPYNITFNSNFINNTSPRGGGVNFFVSFVNVAFNGEFIANSADNGGAIAARLGIIENASFKNNRAEKGGAVYFDTAGKVINCSFTNNTGSTGGAVHFNSNGNVLNSNFTDNIADYGSAIYFCNEDSDIRNISNSYFLNNRANADKNTPFNVTVNESSIEIVFMGQDNLINAIYSESDLEVNLTNVTYWGAQGIANTDNSTPSISNREAGQNITVIGVVNGNIINVTKVTDENGTVVLEVAGNYWIAVSHDEDSYYTQAEAIISQNMTFSVNVSSKTTNNKTVNITANSDIFNEFMPGELLFILPDGTQINATYGDNGTWWAEYTFNEYGEFNVSASYIGLDNVTVSNGTVNITRTDSVITLDDIVMDYGESVNVTVTTEGATGITAKIDGNDVEVVNNFTIPISGLDIGNHTLTVTTIPDSDHNSVNKTVSITVNDYIVVSAPDVTKYYGGDERFVVTVTDSENNPLANQSVSITVNDVTYNRTTDVNGTASIAINLVSGHHNVTTVACNNTLYSNITVLTTVNATDLVKVFRNATQFYATFKDSEGNYLAEGTMVRFNINGVMYDRAVSGDKGLARLNINLEAGSYIITAINPVNGEMSSNNITVISRLIENRDIVKYYRNATQYTVKVIGDDGNPVGAGENVTFNINGVFYTRTTNESGIAKLNINLQPGDYIITAEYKECKVSNNITVLPVLSASDMAKKYGTTDQFVATLLDGQGNLYFNQKVEFNINGVFYYRTTDSSGQAKLNINLQPGEYIITSSYDASNISNTITVYD